MSHRKRHHRLKLKSLYVWHRYVGLAVALLVVVLSITGIVLNHTDGLRLASRYVQSGWLLDWYGIEAPQRAVQYQAGEHRITLLDTQLFLDVQRLPDEHSGLRGMLALNDMLVIAQRDRILLLTTDGRLIEQLGTDTGVPYNLQRLGTAPTGDLIVDAQAGLFIADADYLKWTPWSGDAASVAWSSSSEPTADELVELQRLFRNQILPWERVMLDLHSGRIFGAWGPWLMDAAAGLLLFLAASGTFIWWKRQR